MDKGTHTVRIEEIRRVKNSYVGNPRFELVVSEPGWAGYHTLRTAANSAMNYSVGNKGFRPRDVVEIDVNGRGTVDGMRSTKGVIG